MSGLADHLRRRIALEGPLTVARFMEECLGNPRWGYYATRDPFGQAGDFTTAPEISQMFGEMLGAWIGERWIALGQPDPVHLVELGPGRGTLMADALRAVARLPGFHAAVRVHMVETSPVLRAVQERTLKDAQPGLRPQWWNDVSQVPPGAMLLLANEFFDALPIRQFQRTAEGWHERLVGWGENDGLAFVLSRPQAALPMVPAVLAEAGKGAVVEICPAGLRKVHTIAGRLKSVPGVALIIDYGHARSAAGDTLQAVKGHAYANPLADPGAQDLTAHVDFQQLGDAAVAAGAMAYGAAEQGAFLKALGIEARAAALSARADDRQQGDIAAALDRLTGDTAMGRLFKVLALQHPSLPSPPGF